MMRNEYIWSRISVGRPRKSHSLLLGDAGEDAIGDVIGLMGVVVDLANSTAQVVEGQRGLKQLPAQTIYRNRIHSTPPHFGGRKVACYLDDDC